MVKGMDVFTSHFEKYADHYILIGGGACDVQMQEKGVGFRATKDLDIILIVEALTNDFVNHFWQFIKDGEYVIGEVGNKKTFYRFIKPNVEGYPYMIELFSRRPDVIKEIEGMHLTDIPTGEEVSSLSAILLDDEFYNFTLSNSQMINGLHVANDIALICLKARAFLNNLELKQKKVAIQENNIVKHKNDIIRLTATLTPGTTIQTPSIMKNDLIKYIGIVKSEKPDVNQILKGIGTGEVTLDEIIKTLEDTFALK